jgi:fatty-acyl-CoA synthase
MWFGDWTARGALYWPDDVAVVDVAKGPAGRFTYRALNDRANRLASWLRSRGVRSGDRVGLLAHNGVEVLDALFACGKLGAILVPYNWRLHPSELAESVKLTGPAALLCSGELAPALAAAPLPPVRVHLDGDAGPGSVAYDAALAEGSPAPIENPRMKEDDVLVLLFTGGTTGLPKAASVTYRQVAWNTFATVVHEVQPKDVTITHTPMFHTGGLLVYTLPILTVGGRVVVMRRWDPAACLRLLAEEGVTLFFAVPTQYQQLAEVPGFAEVALPRLRFLTSGGAPMPEPLRAGWQAAHRSVPFKQGFGMTEFGPGIFSMEPKDAVRKAGSIGRPNHFVEARLVDEERHEVAADEVGELWLRGPACFAGYWKNPVATAGAIDGNGWFHTGDLARRDDEGFFTVVGRKKDMFISGGENVFPFEIEQALQAHLAVAQAAVVGVADPRWGEVGAAFVTLRTGATASPDELLEHLRARLARYKVPKTITVLEAMPVSAAGKILKTELRRLAQGATR